MATVELVAAETRIAGVAAGRPPSARGSATPARNGDPRPATTPGTSTSVGRPAVGPAAATVTAEPAGRPALGKAAPATGRARALVLLVLFLAGCVLAAVGTGVAVGAVWQEIYAWVLPQVTGDLLVG